MSSLILSRDSHLMMLEISVENLFVPWTTAFDKVILKKTVVMFRLLDQDWISLSPNRRDGRPYQGSNCENEKFYGGISVVFSVPASFFGREASGVGVQLDVRRQVCKYFETVSRQRIGSATIPVDNLLNSIAKQIRERNELAEHLSDFYKRQIISRSTTGTYTLLDENFRSTAATISLYIRISYLGECLITEIAEVKSVRGAFYIRGDSDEKQPYFSRRLTSEELQSGCWPDGGFPRVPRGLICRCEELVKKESADLAKDGDAIKRGNTFASKVADADAVEKGKTPADAVADSAGNPVSGVVANKAARKIGKAPADAVADSGNPVSGVVANKAARKTGKAPADAAADSAGNPAPGVVANKAARKTGTAPADAAANSAGNPASGVVANKAARKTGKAHGDAAADSAANPASGVVANKAARKTGKAPGDAAADSAGNPAPGVVANKNSPAKIAGNPHPAVTDADADALANPHEGATFSTTTTDDEVINATADIRRKLRDFFSANMKAKMKGYAIRNNGEEAIEKAFVGSRESKFGRNTATITEGGKQMLTPPSPPLSCLQTYPLCCQLQPHLTCFTDCFDVSRSYCYWTACPLQFFYSA